MNVLDGVQDGLDGGVARVTVDAVVSSLNDRGFGAFCAVIGALAVTPVIGAVPASRSEVRS